MAAEAFNAIALSRKQFIGELQGKQVSIKTMIDDLQRENNSLRTYNDQLRAENAQMKGETYKPPPAKPSDAYIVGNYAPTYDRTSPNFDNKYDGDPRKAYRQARVLRTHEAPIHAANFTEIGGVCGVVATASWDATIQIYDLEQSDDQALVRTLGGEDNEDGSPTSRMGGLYDVAFSKTQANIIAAASSDKNVYVWNWETNKMLKKLGGHKDEVNGVSFHHNKAMMVSSSDDATACVWDYHEGLRLRTLTEHTKAVYGAVFLGPENDNNVATCSFDQKVRMFDLRTKDIVETFQAHTDDVIGIDFSTNNRMLATGSDDGCICLWDMRMWGPPLHKIDTREIPGAPENEVKRVTFNRDGTKLASGNSSQQVLVYDLTGPTPAIFGILDGRAPHKDCVFDCAFGYDRNGAEFIIDASHDQMSYVWHPQR